MSTKQTDSIIVDDKHIIHEWQNPNNRGEVSYVGPGFYADAGIPVCGEDSEQDGNEMEYVRTIVTDPRIVACVNALAGINDPADFIGLVSDEVSNHCEPDGSPCKCALCYVMNVRRSKIRALGG